MAHCGIAMSDYHQLWSPPSAEELRSGQQEIDQAVHMGAALPRERQFIEAAAVYYKDVEHVPPPVRAKAYADAMAEVARDNPKDTEAQVFYALALIATAPLKDRTHANQKRAAAILEPIYREQTDHPGVAHYLIHTYDSTELAPRGLAAARAYSKIAPSAPHACTCPRISLSDWVGGMIPLPRISPRGPRRTPKATRAKNCMSWTIRPMPICSEDAIPTPRG